jgi:hypothetical protein
MSKNDFQMPKLCDPCENFILKNLPGCPIRGPLEMAILAAHHNHTQIDAPCSLIAKVEQDRDAIGA